MGSYPKIYTPSRLWLNASNKRQGVLCLSCRIFTISSAVPSLITTTEDQVEQTHIVRFDGSGAPSRQPRFGRRGGYFQFRSISR
jgi:hypothetical protein